MKRVTTVFLAIVLMVCVLAGCASGEANPSSTPTPTQDAATTLIVALYGQVPDVERFENAVQSEWSKVEPNIALTFVSWDCYESDPTEDLDVIVFDGLYLQHYIKEGFLLPIPDEAISDKGDLLDFAIDGCTVDGAVYAIPQIICTNLLFYRNGDADVANAHTVDALYSIVGDRKTTELIPENNEGLLIDMSSGTSNVCLYLDALIDHTQEYTDYKQLPDPNDWNEEVIARMKMLQKMAGKESASYWPDDNDAYIRAKWFQEGNGRTYIGFTEAMSNMGNYVNEIGFKLLSYCEHSNIPLFYGDLVGVNSSVSADKKDAAIKLTDLIAASDTMVSAISPDVNNAYPQYLLPARKSVYDRLGSTFPVYAQLKVTATNPQNKLFLLGDHANSWLEDAKGKLKEILKNGQ